MEETGHICARCARAGSTCCQFTRIFLSHGDVRRIGEAVGDEAFWERVPPEAGDGPDPAYDPVWSRIFDAAGHRRVLRHRGRGDCHFLTVDGCRLSPEVRPLVCRLYPYDYTHRAIKGVHGHLCPRPERDNPSLLLAMLGMNRQRAEEWRSRLYREIEEEYGSGPLQTGLREDEGAVLREHVPEEGIDGNHSCAHGQPTP